jgi:hypothetical protein
MSSLIRSSKSPLSIEELNEPNRSFGPSPDSPDFILWPTLALHGREDGSIKPRSQIQVSDCRQPTTITQTDDRTASIRDKTAAFKAQLAPWLGGYNRQNRSEMDSNTTGKEETLSDWKAQVNTIAANISKSEGITIIVCPNQTGFAQMVSKHVQTPNKTERRLINKLNLPKLAPTVSKPSVAEDEILGYYDSDPGRYGDGDSHDGEETASQMIERSNRGWDSDGGRKPKARTAHESERSGVCG